MNDDMGNRLKGYENRTRYYLPKRTYTLIRLDGKSFHTYTKGLAKPFDMDLVQDMQETTISLCRNIQGCKLGYTQSDEITLLLTDFEDIHTEPWFGGNLQKICSVSSSMATAYFNSLRHDRNHYSDKMAFFDSRVWTISDPWEVFNTFLWRQQDATRNAIQMVAQSLYSHKELQSKNSSQLQEMIFQKGQNFDHYPTVCKRGTFVYYGFDGIYDDWLIDRESPIISQNRRWFFSKIPLISQPEY